MLSKLDYKNVPHRLFVEGIFKDGKDSLYYITGEEVWHITFKKVDGVIEEWVRELVLFDGIDEFFLSEVDFRYTSTYKSMGGVRNFIKKQLDYMQYKDIINEFVKSRYHRSKFNMRQKFYGNDPDVPF